MPCFPFRRRNESPATLNQIFPAINRPPKQRCRLSIRNQRPLKIVIPPRAGPGAQPAIPAAGGDQGHNIINRNLPYREAPPFGRELPIFRPCASKASHHGRYAAGAGCPEKSPMRASGIRFSSYAKVSIIVVVKLRDSKAPREFALIFHSE